MGQIFAAILLFASAVPANAQIVISLLFGDKLNTETIKFGLDGGASWTNLTGLDGSESHVGLNLGFYFDIRLKENTGWYLHTGLMVKSPLGAEGIAPYSLEDPGLDSIYSDGIVERQLRYFNVPVLARYKFKDRFFIEAGPNFGLLYKAKDVFYQTMEEEKDLSYTNNIRDRCNRFDIGAMAGVGMHLMKGNGMNIGFRYYLGLMDVMKDNSSDPQQNRVYYLFASIPIGAGEKSEKKHSPKQEN